MAAKNNFKPRASSNLIEEGVTENVDVVETSEEVPATEETAEVVAPTVEDAKTETVEETTEAPKEDKKSEEVTFKAETTKKPIERKVKICLAKKYDGCIGGEWYHFAKDQVVTVPENVKRILNSIEGMLKPL